MYRRFILLAILFTAVDLFSQRHGDYTPPLQLSIKPQPDTYKKLQSELKITNAGRYKVLYIKSDSITSVPEEICAFYGLRDISLEMLSLKQLPKCFSGLKVKSVGIGFSNPGVLKFKWHKLDSLEELILEYEGSDFKDIPKELISPPRLKYLDIGGYSNEELPEWLFSSKQFVKLAFTDGHLKKLNSSLTAQKESLVSLDLENNAFEIFPEQIVQLNKLEALYLRGNLLTGIPGGIAKLENLKYLSLDNNKLRSLPDEIDKLKKLARLSLKNNLFTEEEKTKLKRLLPNTEITF